jgi:uncharacterized protein (TIGR00369 family)
MTASHSPINSEFEREVRSGFARQRMMTTLGAVLERVAPGEVEISLPFSPALTQQHGFLHAAATTAIADSANGFAALTLAPPGSEVLAVEFKINLVAPARAPRFLARGRVLRPGRQLTVCLAEVVGANAGEETLVATMLSTISVRTGR